MRALTVFDYFGKYEGHEDATSERRATAARLLDKVNAALLLAELDGVKIQFNPLTGCHIAGEGNGGFRPQDAVDRNGRPVGAGHSKHKSAEACDLYDPERRLAAWSIANEARLKALGILAIEDPRWTPSWAHWQVVGVPSGHFAFVPSSDPALAAAPAPWSAA